MPIETIPPFDEVIFLGILATKPVPDDIQEAARERLKAHRIAYEYAQRHQDPISEAIPGDASRFRAKAARQALPTVEKLEAIHAVIRCYYEDINHDK